MKKLGVIIFDIDGTLFDSMNLYTETFCKTLLNFRDIPFDYSKKLFLATSGLPLDQQFKLALRDYKNYGDKDIINLVNMFWDSIRYIDVPVINDAVHVVRTLANSGYTVVASSGSDQLILENRLKQAGIYRDFQLVMGTDYIGNGLKKGDSHFVEIKNKLLTKNQNLSSSAIMVGDGAHDSELAMRFGVLFLCFARENLDLSNEIAADLYINNLIDLLSLLWRKKNDIEEFIPINEFIRLHRED